MGRLPLVGGIIGAAIGGVVALLLLALLVSSKLYGIPGEAMEPSLQPGDRVLALRLWLVEPDADDIVVYDIPDEGAAKCGFGGAHVHRITRLTPEGYFMQGDNRRFSCDSRVFGPVERDRVHAEVVAIVWPPSRWGLR